MQITSMLTSLLAPDGGADGATVSAEGETTSTFGELLAAALRPLQAAGGAAGEQAEDADPGDEDAPASLAGLLAGPGATAQPPAAVVPAVPAGPGTPAVPAEPAVHAPGLEVAAARVGEHAQLPSAPGTGRVTTSPVEAVDGPSGSTPVATDGASDATAPDPGGQEALLAPAVGEERSREDASVHDGTAPGGAPAAGTDAPVAGASSAASAAADAGSSAVQQPRPLTQAPEEERTDDAAVGDTSTTAAAPPAAARATQVASEHAAMDLAALADGTDVAPPAVAGDAPLPDGGPPPGGPGSLAASVRARVEEAVAALRNAPPPREASIEVEGMRLTIRLVGDVVHLTSDQALPGSWGRELGAALAGRGLQLAGGDAGGARPGGDPGGNGDRERAGDDQPRTTPGRAPGRTDDDLRL